MEKQTVDKSKKKIKLMIMMGNKYSLEVIFNDYFFQHLSKHMEQNYYNLLKF